MDISFTGDPNETPLETDVDEYEDEFDDDEFWEEEEEEEEDDEEG